MTKMSMYSFSRYLHEAKGEPLPKLKFVIYCATLKKDFKNSNSHNISLLVQKALQDEGCDCEIIMANQQRFEPGVDLNKQNGSADDMTRVLQKIQQCDGLIVSTPIWWGVYSSYVQALFERMVYFDDQYIKKDHSVLYGKTFGGIISGEDDGWQQIQGLMGNFASSLGFTLPPEGFISDMNQSKNKINSDKELHDRIRVFVRNQKFFAETLRNQRFNEIQLTGVNKTGETYT